MFTFFLPAAGWRERSADGELRSQGSRGFFWSSTQSGASSGLELEIGPSTSRPDRAESKAFAYTIRCVR